MAPLLASEYDVSKYLRAEDLKQEKKLRIKEVTDEVLNDRKTGKPENKPVVWFTTIKQGLVLNKTNNRTLRGAFGDLLSGWKGKIVVIYPTMTEMGLGLRVRIPPPKQPVASSPVTPSNGAAVVVAAPPAAAAAPLVVVPLAAAVTATAVTAAADPDLEPDPVLSTSDELDDEIGF
jgi:hypothetical protein